MKAFSTKTYAALVLGSLQARHDFVAAKLDLIVDISPGLSFKNGRLSIDQMKQYTVSIHSSQIEGRSAVATVVAGGNHAPTDLWNWVARLTNQRGGNAQNESKDDLYQSLLKKPGTADLEDQSDIWNNATPIREKLNDVLHTTGWTLPGIRLSRWFELKLLYASNCRTFFMKRKTYVERYDGIYTHTSTANKGVMLKLGLPVDSVAYPTTLKEQQSVSATLIYNDHTYSSVGGRLDLDGSTIGVPPVLYEPILQDLRKFGLREERDRNGQILLKRQCSSTGSYGLSIMDISVKTDDRVPLDIYFSDYTVNERKRCTAMFVESTDDTLFFGAPMLKSYVVIIHSTNGALSYYIRPRNEPVSSV